MSRPAIALQVYVLDTPDPSGLASFYAVLLGWDIDDAATDDDWVQLRAPAGGGLAFQLAPEFTPSTWPDDRVGLQAHLDLEVDDLDAAEEWVLRHGATRVAGPNPSPTFRTYRDPSGHLFCLVRSA
ncbi:VOC family protein [Rhodococcus sp. 14C212]|uniref:VOC family protein n=1 Tax=Rhodococcus sp. 14C212 TaxID=2711209 RepID=UPI0013EC02F4|nr:VOC family protein [Rhodococcus sp. 14C212]NGP08501.1 VOC family protein [Rhodococcus sp. 14C212]